MTAFVKHVGLIPKSRLLYLPEEVRSIHELCFFLHDEIVRILSEYEGERANVVTVNFTKKSHAEEFENIADTSDAISAMLELGYEKEAQQVILNQITMGLVSDALHHIYEALRCFEKRKFVVGFNLLRKPLKDTLLYLAWLFGEREQFYSEFMKGDPGRLTQSLLGNRRIEIFDNAAKQTDFAELFSGYDINDTLYNRKNQAGMEMLFQHAVHLITTQNVELKTSPHNFNFVFKNILSDDVYFHLYGKLPNLLMFFTHVVFGLFNQMHVADEGARHAFLIRTYESYALLTEEVPCKVREEISTLLSENFCCRHCQHPVKLTDYNYARVLMTESMKCTRCRKVDHFPFSWMF